MLSYRRDAPTLRRGRDQPGYLGESWTAEGGIPIQPDFWSPNRLIFRLRPGQEVFINQNPGSWWLVNGRRQFADRRIAEPMLPFLVRADDAGRLELRIDPPGRRLGVILHLVGASILAAYPLAAPAKSRPATATQRTVRVSVEDVVSYSLFGGPAARPGKNSQRPRAAGGR